MALAVPGSEAHVEQLNLIQTLTLLPGANTVSSLSFTRQLEGLDGIVSTVQHLLFGGQSACLPIAAVGQLPLRHHLFNLDHETWNPVVTEGLSSGGRPVPFPSVGLDVGDFVRIPVHLDIIFLRVHGDGLPRPSLQWGFDKVLRLAPAHRATMVGF